ncbi:MAG: hypothetical protein FD180_2690 [Planctomycetota bacterium]|nr:MAG: hypothetical protein FD180_2690 [Planctomycetota bacterium]
MARVALASFLLGAVIAGVLFKFLESRREIGAKPQSAPRVAAASPETSDADPEVLRLRASLAQAELTVEGLRKEIAALKAGAAPKTGGSGTASWKAVFAKIFEAQNEKGRLWVGNDAAVQDLLFQLQSLMREAAALQGIELDELTMAPDGLPALAAALMENSDPPLDAAQRQKFLDVLDGARAEWDGYAKTRGSLTKLEKDRELGRMWDKLESGMSATLPEGQIAAWDDLTSFWSDAAPSTFYGGYSWQSFDSKEEAERELSNVWGDDLGLDAAQKVTLRSVANEYIQEMERLHADEVMRGVDSTPVEDLREVMIRMNRRIAATLTLTEKQAAALRNWSRVDHLTVR